MGHPKKRNHLTSVERNFLNYVKTHMSRHKNVPCFVPQPANNQIKDYLRGIAWLEENEFIQIHKESITDDYRRWIVKPGSKFNLTNNFNEPETTEKFR